MEERKVRVAITHGDTNGIGYELIFKTFASPEILDLCTPIIYGSPKIAAYHRKALGIESAFSIISSAEEARDGRVNLLTCFEEEVKVELGNKTQEGEQAGAKALKRALEDQKTGAYDVLVMAPLEKNSVVEQLGLLVMMNEDLRVAFATNAIDLKEVAQKITKERVVSKATAISSYSFWVGSRLKIL
jgi:4-hydroxythreonine-4-phosphate dehydrogenase